MRHFEHKVEHKTLKSKQGTRYQRRRGRFPSDDVRDEHVTCAGGAGDVHDDGDGAEYDADDGNDTDDDGDDDDGDDDDDDSVSVCDGDRD